MKNYNFDEIIDRRGSSALKTDALAERFGKSDLIPLWIADMEFKCADFIIEALHKRTEHGIFGYTQAPQSYYNSIINWVKEQHNWNIKQEWISFIPGIVKGLALAIMNFSKPGDKIIIQPPVYPPFSTVPNMHKREIVCNPLIEKDGGYEMDLDGLTKIIDKDCKMLILCNPHNPVGITWKKETLQRLAEICYDNNILVISDEIHADMALWDNVHIPFATVSEKARENSITFMAPSKTFNIAGLIGSFAVVPNEELRKSFFYFLESCELNHGTIHAFTATEAAYSNGAEWKRQMLRYVENNMNFINDYLKENIPEINAFKPSASFLIWLDCRALNLTQAELVDFFINKAGLALNDGETFGKEGIGFMRLNIGCPKAILEQALSQLKDAIVSLRS